MKISNRLKNNFEDALTDFTKKEISRFFEDNDIENKVAEVLTNSSQRRTLVRQFYNSINWGDSNEVQNVLFTFSDILIALEEKAKNYNVQESANSYLKLINQIKINLAKDGLVYDGKLITGNLATISHIQTKLHQPASIMSMSAETITTTPKLATAAIALTLDYVKETSAKVFISYSWDSPAHEDKVVRFTNYLRDNGFYAEVDKLLSQKESAIDFHKMMHQTMTNYQKIIIVLSSGYKQKAENFAGGVGTEYALIIKDIVDNPNKYILVSFEKLTNNILPLALKGREVLDLTITGKDKVLFHKLKNQPIYAFSEVAATTPTLTTLQPGPFELPNSTTDPFEIVKLSAIPTDSVQQGGSFVYVCNDYTIEIKNISTVTISDYNIDVVIPSYLLEATTVFRKDGENSIINFRHDQKIYAGQSLPTSTFSIKVTNHNYIKALEAKLKVIIYSDLGSITKEFYLKDSFIVKMEGVQNTYLPVANFGI